ncbi:MAG: preprotein translocase subunit SecE [Candidatus Hydrogenedentes bacterium]|nr:preprotein translocase subunit SecE [Candidatus Hydrogenedentota bacterium]
MATKQVTAPTSGTPKQAPTSPTQAKPGLIATVREFFEDVVSEMKKVSWPTQAELKSLTQLVLWSLLISGIVLGIYDFIFNNLMALILKLG